MTNTVRVKILRDVMIAGKAFVAGTIATLSKHDATLLAYDKQVAIETEPEALKAAPVVQEVIETQKRKKK